MLDLVLFRNLFQGPLSHRTAGITKDIFSRLLAATFVLAALSLLPLPAVANTLASSGKGIGEVGGRRVV